MAHMMKSTLGVGGVKPKFRKVPRVVFLCLGGGVGCQTEISKSTRVLFLRKMTIISLEINGKCIYFQIFLYYLAKSFATFVVISKTWNTFQRLNIF